MVVGKWPMGIRYSIGNVNYFVLKHFCDFNFQVSFKKTWMIWVIAVRLPSIFLVSIKSFPYEHVAFLFVTAKSIFGHYTCSHVVSIIKTTIINNNNKYSGLYLRRTHRFLTIMINGYGNCQIP